ncbi:MAG: UDP-N-acetylmuramoyl-tripeptide--D-alanyl-D-alanine ligase [Bacteroidales bacterium]|nr:UDP-N-acetylmuramoyl-tripeptide--D-alanyl-D-alanine ligase [Bacteroidales bacterium]
MDNNFLYNLYLNHRKISTDSRNIIPGCLFFALRGENFNGNLFAHEAIEKGAGAALVDEDMPQPHPMIFRVDNVLQTLQQLAGYHRVQSGLKILAITGSNGKTTTKELCREVLSKKFRVFATEGNLNNHIGVPLTLLSMDSSVELGIVEMGANHPGEIAALCEIARPDYGLITNIGKAHLEGFGGIEGVAKAKGELFRHLMENGKTIFLNRGNSYLVPQVPESYPGTVEYNGSEGVSALQWESNPFLCLNVVMGEKQIQINTHLVGSYNIENVLASCAVGLHFDIAPDAIAAAVSAYRPSNNRSQLIDTGKNKVIMDAYNANPSSMAASISEFLKFEGGNKILILGEMREVGDSSIREHESIIASLKEKGVGHVICMGKAFENAALNAGFKHAGTIDQLMQMLTDDPPCGYLILIKGSRCNRLEKIIPLL